MKCTLLGLSLLLIGSVAAQEEKRPIIYVKHLEPPVRYPPVARATMLHGAVIVTLTIAPDGVVLNVESMPGDNGTVGYPLLRDETERLVKRWTFACVNCSPNAPCEKKIKFIYRIEGEGIRYDNTKVVMDLPDEVTITVNPPECDHCPSKKKGNK